MGRAERQGKDRLHLVGAGQRRRIIVVEAQLVAGRHHQQDSGVVCGLDGLGERAWVVDAAHGRQHHAGAHRSRVAQPGGEDVALHQNGVADTDHEQRAIRATARHGAGVAGCADRLLGAPLAVRSLGELAHADRTRAVAEEIPAAHVVDQAVAVVVDAVRERIHQIFGVRAAVVVVIAHAGISGVVVGVESSIVVGVVVARTRRTRQLTAVQEQAFAQGP